MTHICIGSLTIIGSIFRWKNCTYAEALVQFFLRKIEQINRLNKTCFTTKLYDYGISTVICWWLSARQQYLHWRYCCLALSHQHNMMISSIYRVHCVGFTLYDDWYLNNRSLWLTDIWTMGGIGHYLIHIIVMIWCMYFTNHDIGHSLL